MSQPDPVAFVQKQGAELLQAAATLRDPAFLPAMHAPPGRWDEALITCRARLDSMEGYLIQATALRTSIRLGSRDALNAATDARDTYASAEQRRIGRQEYESAKDREVRWNMATIQENRNARQWQNATDMADSVYEQVRLMYQGLSATRQDIATHLRHQAWENNLERSA